MQTRVDTTSLQAITTKYLGPTDTKPSRVKATTASKRHSVTLSWAHEYDANENHARAARALIERMGWDEHGWHWHGAESGGGYVFVTLGRRDTLPAFVELIEYALGNREPREGNPYCRPTVNAALQALADYTGGNRDWSTVMESYRPNGARPGTDCENDNDKGQPQC